MDTNIQIIFVYKRLSKIFHGKEYLYYIHV
jgi:hypothetical protein